ncbi:MAG: hypothetical protein DMG00_29975 [Acidobacteria bacterium]|nr:MAG: hypothetical protein DMG00_29975 [Acidobacteriota bacterium]
MKRILGTAEDYRRLYGGTGSGAFNADDVDAQPAVSHKAAPAPAKKATANAPAPAKKATPAKKKASAKRTRKAA